MAGLVEPGTHEAPLQQLVLPARDCEDLRLEAMALGVLAEVERTEGRSQEAVVLLERAIALRDRVGDARGAAFDLVTLAWLASTRRDPAAPGFLERARLRCVRHGLTLQALTCASMSAGHRGADDEAFERLVPELAHHGGPLAVAFHRLLQADVALRRGDRPAATRWLATATEAMDQARATPGSELRRLAAAVEERLGTALV